MSKHTPSPWALNGEGIVHHPVTGKSIVTKRIETSLGNIEVIDETNEPDENLRLIVATPKLYSLVRLWLATDLHGVHSDACRKVINEIEGQW
jgi:hypothetical protein